ncbi:MAG: glycoside hydrolase family 43 protein [Clostridia bacterium]|nr:glycoside hydrolase family 43 protein [Clostridia bacterium]
MKKKILRLLLAGLMGLSLAACQNEPTTEVDWTVHDLNLQLPLKNEPVESGSVEQVIKFSTECLAEDATSKEVAFNVEKFDVPAGSTLEYDVYLETDAVGMGIFDIKLGKNFLSGSKGLTDESGVPASAMGNECVKVDLRLLSSGRWYHRVIHLPNTETETVSRVKFTAGSLVMGETNVCYYDNICVKDSAGNIVAEITDDYLASVEIYNTKKATSALEKVDDPAPNTERRSASDFAYISASCGTATGKDMLQLTFTLGDKYAAPAIYLGDVDAFCNFGVKGYVLTVKENELVLYSSGETVKEIASKTIILPDLGEEITIRLEVNGNELRGYYVDDMEGVEPWPEFVVSAEDMAGKSYGAMELYGRDCTVISLANAALEVEAVETTYVNPVILDSADPEVVYHDGVYYLYNTSAGYKVYTSTDLVNWEYQCETFDPAFTWSDEPKGWQWAPDVEYYNGKFYMVCSIDEQLGIAVADSPLGPFIPEEERFFDKTIDGNLFVDDDGQAYLYYVSFDGRDGEDFEYGIYCSKINLETLELDYASEVQVITVTEQFERYHDHENRLEDGGVTEGPYMLKQNGLYYLTYSGSDYESQKYAVGYAVSESPMGPFVKYEGNPIHIGNANVAGTAHHCFIRTDDSDEFLIFYHNHLDIENIHPRGASIDRARFAPTESGIDRLETYGPTTTPQKMPLD